MAARSDAHTGEGPLALNPVATARGAVNPAPRPPTPPHPSRGACGRCARRHGDHRGPRQAEAACRPMTRRCCAARRSAPTRPSTRTTAHATRPSSGSPGRPGHPDGRTASILVDTRRTSARRNRRGALGPPDDAAPPTARREGRRRRAGRHAGALQQEVPGRSLDGITRVAEEAGLACALDPPTGAPWHGLAASTGHLAAGGPILKDVAAAYAPRGGPGERPLLSPDNGPPPRPLAGVVAQRGTAIGQDHHQRAPLTTDMRDGSAPGALRSVGGRPGVQ